MAGILDGLRLVECAAFVAAPLGGMTLAQLGADVIRCDPPGGGLDHNRWPVTRNGKSLYWSGLNKGKRSIAVDTATPRGREIVTALAAAPGPHAGLFVTNLPARGWLAYETLRKRRADLIMVNILGNPDGSSAVDYTVNCAAGFPLATGPTDRDGPVNHLLPAWDAVTGVTAAVGLLAAERHRSRTGEGQLIKLPLSDVAFAMVGNLGHIAEAQVNGDVRPRHGNALFGAFGRDFLTREGRRLMVVAITAKQWQSLVEATGLAAEIRALQAERQLDFRREGDRFLGRDALFPLFERWIASRDLADVAKAFDRLAVCWGRYRDFGDLVANDPRCSPANPMFRLVDQPGIGRYLMPGSPLDFSAVERLPPAPAPLLGQHTDEILAGVLGLSSGQIGELHDRKIVAGPEGG
ncbi:MAG: 2-methylfumaryl-CoA isomerase [Alphaproteobacteria bacterium]|nr:2-methylfumaryl-CoA isomerase [Alphaproteobacteria bacterium]